MTFAEYKYLLYTDLYRIQQGCSFGALLRQLVSGEGFKYNFWLRTSAFLKCHLLSKYLLFPIAAFFLRRVRYKLGISIPVTTRIGSGFYIGHFGGIVVNGLAIIGRNCNISQGVTIGQANRGRNAGYPVIGDNVYLGPGAKIVGGVKIGNNVAIGANCVVTKDIPDGSVVVGVPGRVISQLGSRGYVNRTDY